MDQDQFTENAPGELVTTTVDGYESFSFIPDDLDAIDLDQGDFTKEIGQAMRMLGALEYLGPKAGSSTMLIEVFARKEAVQSSRIEGTQVTLSDVYEKLDELLEYTNVPQPIHALIKLGLIHYQFETIHPFRDGNGRLGRLLVSLGLQREELLTEPYLYLSAYFNEYRDDYTNLLTHVRTHGAWDDWLHFFLRGIWQQAKEAVERGEQLLELRRTYVTEYQTHRSEYILPLTQQLFKNPYITAKQAEQQFGFSHTTAYSLIETLEEDGVLTAVESDGSSQLYQATDIYERLDKPLSES